MFVLQLPTAEQRFGANAVSISRVSINPSGGMYLAGAYGTLSGEEFTPVAGLPPELFVRDLAPAEHAAMLAHAESEGAPAGEGNFRKGDLGYWLLTYGVHVTTWAAPVPEPEATPEPEPEA